MRIMRIVRTATVGLVAALLGGGACARAARTAPPPDGAVVSFGATPEIAPRVEASPMFHAGSVSRLRLAEPVWVAVVADYGGALELVYPTSIATHNRWTFRVRQGRADPGTVEVGPPTCSPRIATTEVVTDPATKERRAVPSISPPDQNCRPTTRPRGRPRQLVYLASRDPLQHAAIRRALAGLEPTADPNETAGLLAEAFDRATEGRPWGATLVRNLFWNAADYENRIR